MLSHPKKFLLNLGSSALSSLILLWCAFNNGYPLVHSDTGTYIFSSFTLNFQLHDKPIGYGLFLMFGRLFDSLWFPVVLQSLITSLLLFRIAAFLLPEVKRQSLIAIGAVILTVLITDVSLYVSGLMPDIFTSWLFLGGLLFFLSSGTADKVLAVGTITIAFIAHNSHVPLSFFSVLFLLIFSWKLRSKFPLFWRNSTKLSLVVLILTIGFCTLNLILDDRFTLATNQSVFYINKLAYHGILTKTLDRYCPQKNWNLCRSMEIIRLKGNEQYPNWFFWGKDSPLHDAPGWKTNPDDLKEYRDIIWQSLRSFFPMILQNSLLETFKQLTSSGRSMRLHKYGQNDSVFVNLKRYDNDFPQFQNGKQQSGIIVKTRMLPVDPRITSVIFVAAAMIALWLLISDKNYFLSGILFALFIFLLLNAIVIGFTVAVETRYQGRILWLIPYFAFLILADLMRKHRQGVVTHFCVASCL